MQGRSFTSISLALPLMIIFMAIVIVLGLTGCKEDKGSKAAQNQTDKIKTDSVDGDFYRVDVKVPEPEPEPIIEEPDPEPIPDFVPEVSFPDPRPLLREERARALRGRRSSLSRMSDSHITTQNDTPQYHLQDEDYQQGETTFAQDVSTLPVDRTRILTADMRIPAILEDGINTQMAGRVIAVVDRDVLSPNGKKVLLPAYTKVVCFYEGLSDAHSSRLSLQCKRLIRPDGSSVALTDATSADQMGRSGLSGDLDNRNFEKYGVALGVSIISALAQSSASLNKNEAFGNATNQLSNNLGQVTQQVLEKNLDIRPILTIPQGTKIHIIPFNDIVMLKPQPVLNQSDVNERGVPNHTPQ